MIKNFNEVKEQLGELASAINSFKSEAVQLKIIELIFKGVGSAIDEKADDPKATGTGNQSKARKTARARIGNRTSEKQGARKGGRPGPGEMIDRLITDGFFKQPRTIREIIDHCGKKLAYSYSAQEFSVSLNRAVRSKKLTRNENKDGQYEYNKA